MLSPPIYEEEESVVSFGDYDLKESQNDDRWIKNNHNTAKRKRSNTFHESSL